LAIQHGYAVEVLAINETLQSAERTIDGPAFEHPDVQSLWWNWPGYFINQFAKDRAFKADDSHRNHRFICQNGRWQSFIFTK
jgi:hypothetical protein